MGYVILDLEATCWAKRTSPERMETIEIGGVRLDVASLEITDEFSRFVRPVAEPALSDFCTELTGIAQADVDAADDFKTVFPSFLDWTGPGLPTLCSWGAYDVRQFEVDCRRHGMPTPAILRRHLNLKQTFATWRGTRPCGMKAALRMLGLPLEGRHHRALADARNIARIARVLLPGIATQATTISRWTSGLP